jgi:mannosyl-oligosaccharide alpha-1,2-mannosidase
MVAAVFLITYLVLSQTDLVYIYQGEDWQAWKYIPSTFDWRNRLQAHPVEEATMVRLPEGEPRQLPRIQHEFSKKGLSMSHNETQKARREAVKNVAKRSWRAYRDYAWGRDEVAPQTLVGQDTFAGWGATLVDSLDTLWIMGMKKDFGDAVRHVAAIDWNNATSWHCSLFETNIRYLGGLLSAYDLSQEKVLLDKAIELGDMLHAAFDTPNHMPANSFHFQTAKEGKLVASKHESSAAVGSLSLEFTRLSQLTGDSKYYHAVDGIKKELERTQDTTSLPGMWPVFLDLQNNIFNAGTSFSLGASADSAYEYLSKMHVLLGGLDPTYEKMHTKAMATAAKHLLFRPMVPDDAPDVLFPGTVLSNGRIVELAPEIQHLGCFAGGMFALGGRLFDDESHVAIGDRLARGCAWAYSAFPTGVMPESARLIPCQPTTDDDNKNNNKNDNKNDKTNPNPKKEKDNLAPCPWSETRWTSATGPRAETQQLPRGFASLGDTQYLLRPEAIESVFVLYRITGQPDLLDVAWQMFGSIRAATQTRLAHSAISDVRAVDGGGEAGKLDSMEVSLSSFAS